MIKITPKNGFKKTGKKDFNKFMNKLWKYNPVPILEWTLLRHQFCPKCQFSRLTKVTYFDNGEQETYCTYCRTLHEPRKRTK